MFEVVQAGHAVYGVVPFENSTAGPVSFTLDEFCDREGKYPDLTVCGEIYVDVHHMLLGFRHPRQAPGAGAAAHHLPHGIVSSSRHDLGAGLVDDSPEVSGTCTPTLSQPEPPRPRTRPLHGIGHLTRIYSHPQAWGQCTRFAQTYLKGMEQLEASSTSRAAELVRIEAEERYREAEARQQAEYEAAMAAAAANSGVFSPQLATVETTNGILDGGPAATGSAEMQVPDAIHVSDTSARVRLPPPPRSVITVGAIASELAAEVYGLEILARCIEDMENNVTRFLVLRRLPPEFLRDGVVAAALSDNGASIRDEEAGAATSSSNGKANEGNGEVADVVATEAAVATEVVAASSSASAATTTPRQPYWARDHFHSQQPPPPMPEAATSRDNGTALVAEEDMVPATDPNFSLTGGPARPPTAATKSLVSFTVPHRSPGALADVLDCFRRSGLNLTSINSRPSRAQAWSYVFLVEFEGSLVWEKRHPDGTSDGRVRRALEGVAAVADSWRWLGSWSGSS